jgi:hypothetical protein
MITRHKDSHLDHGLTEAQVNHIFERYRELTPPEGVFIETFEMPAELGNVPCGLYGPVMGDEPIPEEEVVYGKRGQREYTSRLIDRPVRQVQEVTIIAGPHDDQPCVLFTAFGGPLTPKEIGDPTLAPELFDMSTDDLANDPWTLLRLIETQDFEKSWAFWSQHALAIQGDERCP